MARLLAHFTSFAPLLPDLQTGLGIVFSAGTYLFDFASNIATAVEYHKIVEKNPSMVGIFVAIVAIILVAHTLNAVVFKLELREDDRPITAAYLFPLVQFRRLVAVLWKTFTWKGLKALKSERKSTLFSLLAAALETGPELALQFSVFIVKLGEGRVSKVLYVSLFASFLSGTANGGIVMLSTTKAALNFWQKAGTVIVAGMFTLSSLILNCVTIIALILWKGWISPVTFIFVELSMYCTLYYSVILKKETSTDRAGGHFNRERLVRSLAWGYISMTIGPLYPMAINARERSQLGKRVYWMRLLVVTGLHLTLQVAVFVLSLAGPRFCRWSVYCVEIFKVPYGHFACSFYIPTSILGIVLFSISVISYVLLNKYTEARHDFLPASNNKDHCNDSKNPSTEDNEYTHHDDQPAMPQFAIDVEHQYAAVVKKNENPGGQGKWNVDQASLAESASSIVHIAYDNKNQPEQNDQAAHSQSGSSCSCKNWRYPSQSILPGLAQDIQCENSTASLANMLIAQEIAPEVHVEQKGYAQADDTYETSFSSQPFQKGKLPGSEDCRNDEVSIKTSDEGLSGAVPTVRVIGEDDGTYVLDQAVLKVETKIEPALTSVAETHIEIICAGCEGEQIGKVDAGTHASKDNCNVSDTDDSQSSSQNTATEQEELERSGNEIAGLKEWRTAGECALY